MQRLVRSTAAAGRSRSGAAVLLGACASLAMVLGATAASASMLLAPAVGIPDQIMAGATVGAPRTPSAAAFSNPAGLTSFGNREMSASAAWMLGWTSVDASAPPGYSSDRTFYGFGPEFGIAFDGPSGWHFGIATYGSVGSSFKSEADPAAGVPNDFFSELSIADIALMAAYEVNDRLSVGASLAALVGWTRLRYTTAIPYAYSLTGPGVQGIVGVRYRLRDDVSLGLGVRVPGRLWADGDMRMPDGHEQDVDIAIRMPAQIFAGANFDLTRRISAGVYGRWTDSSGFGDSYFRFSETPQGNVPLIPDGGDEWRVGVGCDYAVNDRLRVGTSIGYADAMVGDRGVSPLVFDGPDVKVGAGFAYAFDRFTFDMLAGYDFGPDRHVDADQALVFPGRYEMSGVILSIGIRTKL